jgi:hypothetical protein
MLGDQVLPLHQTVSTMNLLKSMVLTVAALTTTAVFAQDGSELASQAAQRMKIAQELRFQNQSDSKATEYVKSDDKARADQTKKTDG